MSKLDVDAKAFLDPFAMHDRSLVANLFLEAVRTGGKTDPAAVTEYVRLLAFERRRKPYAAAKEQERMALLIDGITHNRAGAERYAAYALAWEALPRSERERLRAGSHAAYARAAMEEKPASEKQVAYLLKLGYRGQTPRTMAEASRLIDGFNAKNAKSETGKATL